MIYAETTASGQRSGMTAWKIANCPKVASARIVHSISWCKSMEQMSIVDYLLDQTYDRNGAQHPAPPWMDRERCENCRYWSIYPVEEQPPAGWSVVGQCNKSHEPQMMRNGYWKVSKTSYCQEYEVIR